METARAASPGHVVRLHGAPRIRSMFLQVVRDRGNSLGFQRPTLISGEERSRRPGDRTWSSRSGKKNEQLVGVCASFEQELVSKAGTGQGVLIASTSTAISPSTSSISPSEQHFALVGFIACVAVGTLSCFFLAAIPTLLAFKKAAESLEKLADAAREELPGTMAAVRLSGLEISDLTMELSDLGQEISEGVRSSARAVRAAEDGLRRIGSAASKVLWQPQRSRPREVVVLPALAYAARNMRDSIVQTRSFVHTLATVNRVSSWLISRWSKRSFLAKRLHRGAWYQ